MGSLCCLRSFLFFHVESLLPRRGSRRDATASQRAGTAGRILSSPLEIPAEHKADTSGPVRSKSPPATAAPSVRVSNGAGIPFLTGPRVSQAQNERRSRTNFVFKFGAWTISELPVPLMSGNLIF